MEENALGISWDRLLTLSKEDLGLFQPSAGTLEQGQGGVGSKKEQQHDHPEIASTS